LVGDKWTGVAAVTSEQMVTADMVPDAPCLCIYHRHINDHMLAAMAARYEGKER